jgi:nucleotide-binding universal stress UspA family protein
MVGVSCIRIDDDIVELASSTLYSYSKPNVYTCSDDSYTARESMFTRILVPIDGSEYADSALDYALALAEKFGASIELVHVLSTTSILPRVYIGDPLTAPPVWLSEYIKNMRSNGENILSNALEKSKTIKPGLTISSKLVEGRPANQIVERAIDGGFDLIVIGSRGLGRFRQFVLGSVSDQVANDAECPVLIVK